MSLRRPDQITSVSLTVVLIHETGVLAASRPIGSLRCKGMAAVKCRKGNQKIKTLSGGSLGSRVDEERSQLRELM